MSKKETEQAADEKSLVKVEIPGREGLSLTVGAALQALPAEKQGGIISLFRMMNPDKEMYGEIDVTWRPTILSLKQPTTRKAPDSAKNGDFYSSDTGRVYGKPFEFVPLYPYTNRARFQEGDMKPDCRSEDEVISQFGDICADCMDRPWRGNERQKCQQTMNIIAASPTFDSVFQLQFRGRSFPVGREIIRQAASEGAKPHSRVYSLNSKEETGKGVYYVMTSSFARDLDKDLIPIGDILYAELKKSRMELIEKIKSSISESAKRVDAIDEDISADASSADFSDL